MGLFCEDLVDFKHTKAYEVFKYTFHILKTELLFWNDYLSLQSLDEPLNHVSNSRKSISQGDRSETDVSLQTTRFSLTLLSRPFFRKEKKNQSTKRPNLRVICFVNLYYGELSWISVIVQLRSPCRYHSCERTKITGHLVFVEKGVQQAEWPMIKVATERK